MLRRVVSLLGPAFVAAVAYVDPGNFAANFSAGAHYGYLLLWVLIAANLMAMIAQYLSAKAGIVTGKSLPQLIAERLPTWARRIYWVQAEAVAIATDIAEVLGGAIALNLLFGLPLFWGGVVTCVVSMALLVLYQVGKQQCFERVIVALLLMIPIGFIIGLINQPPDVSAALKGLVPRLQGHDTIMLAAAMLGATIMPHVVYLHSALARDRYGVVRPSALKSYLRATKIDVTLAMVIAGTVNIAMLVLAATALAGQPTESFAGIYHSLNVVMGPLVGVLFGLGLLIASFASTAVGNQAGSVIMEDFLRFGIPAWARRLITALPALGLLAGGLDPMRAIIVSQAILCVGVPFALIPLVVITSRRSIMGAAVNSRTMTVLAGVMVTGVVAINLALLVSFLA